METYTMTGTLVKVLPKLMVGRDRPFAKREVVLSEDPNAQYPTMLCWELTRERADLITEAHQGQTVTISGYPESRAWKSPKTGEVKYFTSFRAINIRLAADESPEEAAAHAAGDDAELNDVPF